MPRNYGTDKHDRPSDAEKVGYEPRVPADWTNVPADVQEALDAQAASGGGLGDVVGPASATNNALARFDLTTGKLIQDSLAILGDTGILTGLIELIVPLISNAAAMDIKTTSGNGNIVITAHGTGIVAIDNGTTVPVLQFGVAGDSPELRFTTSARFLRWDQGNTRFEFSKLLLIIGANNLLLDGSAMSAETTDADLTVKANGTGNFAIINPGSAIQMILDVDAVATSNKTFTFLNENMTPVGVSNTQTLINKTLTTPKIATIHDLAEDLPVLNLATSGATATGGLKVTSEVGKTRLETTGTATNIELLLRSKGSQPVNVSGVDFRLGEMEAGLDAINGEIRCKSSEFLLRQDANASRGIKFATGACTAVRTITVADADLSLDKNVAQWNASQISGKPIAGGAPLNGEVLTYVSSSGTYEPIIPAAGGHGDKGCRIYHSASQAIATGTDTTVAFDLERWDTDGMHSTTVNNGRITVQTKGKYLISCTMVMQTGGSGSWFFWLLLNGATTLCQWEGSTTLNNNMTMQTIVDLDPAGTNDYVEVIVHQTTGGSKNILDRAQKSTEFMAQLLAGT